MINDGISRGVYTRTTDNTIWELNNFQDFLYRNFKNNSKYQNMLPPSNQPARLYGTAKTHKFESLDLVTVEELKFRPIIA